MGLIAREVEGRGIPTVGLTSAWSITAAVRQPRAAYLDFPLGHTAGRAHDAAMQRQVAAAALALLESATVPEQIVRLPYRWAESDAWKDEVMSVRDADDRLERSDSPQYQSAEDAAAAASQPECRSCVFLQA